MDIFRRRNKPISDEELQQKISKLSPDLQAELLKASDLILQKESEIFLNILRNSREDILQISNEIRQEQTAFKASSSKFETTNESKSNVSRQSNNKLVEFVEKRQQKSKKFIGVVQESVQNKDREAVENYLKAVGRAKEVNTTNMFETPAYTKSTTPTGTRPGTAYKIKFNDIPLESKESPPPTIINIENNDKINSKQEELLNRMKEQNDQALSERERQQNLIMKKKNEKKNRKDNNSEGVAADLIGHSKEVDEKQNLSKIQQEKNVQERLEKIKSNRPPSGNISSSTKNQMFEDIKNDLKPRPNTGNEDRSRSRSHSPQPEQYTTIKVASPTKTSWDVENESTTLEGKHSKKKHKKKREKHQEIQMGSINDGIDTLNIE